VFLTAGFRVVSQLAMLASYVVLVRQMNEASFGALNLLYAVIPVISTVASFGIEQTLRRFQPEYLSRGETAAAAWLLRVAALTRLASNVAVLAILLATWQWLAPVFGLEALRFEFALFGLVILLHFQASIVRASMSAHMQNGAAVALTVVLSVVKLVGYLALGSSGELTLTNAILVDATGYALMYLAMRIVHARRCEPAERSGDAHRDPTERRRLGRYALFNNFNDAGTLLLTSKTDNFFIAAILNPVAVGAYAFYTRLNEMVSQLLPTRQLADVINPLVFAVPAAQAAERLPRYFTLLLNASLAVQLPLTIYAVAYHAEIVEVVFAGKFAEWSWLLPLVAAFGTLNRIAEPVTLLAQYQEKAGIILLSKLFGLYNAAAILVLTPVLGLYGVAIATGTAQLAKNLFIWWHTRQTARWGNAAAASGWFLLLGGGAVALCDALAVAMQAPPLVDLVCGVIVCAIAALAYLRTPALTTSDRQILANVFRGRETRVLGWLGLLPRAAGSTT
jgi:O-antigen/teichoic acid export membrane protein